ncbi:transposase [Aceticella autotrophica]|uniref:Transposase n=1 Tax=Aceticella autotrophica TaxID=2755338 RepID=A0A975GA87_9THEO|nr:transposase [Aceticella autotrophica]QSZ26936.1 transposase [Aceticella autotrophica]
MGRQARQFSKTGLYHIVFRGICRQNIFEEDNDFIKMLKTIQELKQEMQFKIYAYCLMNNHVHLLLKEENTGDISLIMKRLLTKYAGWFNRKYSRSGALIANRYKSQPVEIDEYLSSLIRYIHQNPIRAKIVTHIDKYRWSSYPEYMNESIITDTGFILSTMDRKTFEIYHKQEEKGYYEVNDKIGKSDEYIRQRIIKLIDGKEPKEIGLLPKPERNKIIKQLKEEEGFSIRQIERATGISRGIIARC